MQAWQTGDLRMKNELLDEIDQVQQENPGLQDMLDAIQDVLSGPDTEDEDDGGSDEDYQD